MLPTELGDEPVNNTETDISGANQIRHNTANIGIGRIEALKGRNDQFGLTVDLLAASLRLHNIRNRGEYVRHSEGRRQVALKLCFYNYLIGMQHDPSVSLLAQGSGKIVAMSGGGSTVADPYGNAVAAALSAALSSPSSTQIPVVVNNSVSRAAASALVPTVAVRTPEEIHLTKTGISLKGNETGHFLIDKLSSGAIDPASKPTHNATAATEYDTGALTTPAGKKAILENITKALDNITAGKRNIPIQVKVSTG